MDLQDVLRTRQCMLSTIFGKLQKWNPSPTDDASNAKYLCAAKCLEGGLYKLASSKEDYLNPSTLEFRLASIIKARTSKNYNQILQNPSSSSVETTTTTIPEDKEKVVENRDQSETEIAEYLNSMSL